MSTSAGQDILDFFDGLFTSAGKGLERGLEALMDIEIFNAQRRALRNNLGDPVPVAARRTVSDDPIFDTRQQTTIAGFTTQQVLLAGAAGLAVYLLVKK